MSRCVLMGCLAIASGSDAGAAAAGDRDGDGAQIYAAHCIQCHSPGMTGGVGPALKGKDFVAKWDGKRARQLYSRILMTMPANNPGSLSTSEVLALVRFIAQQNALAKLGPPLKSPNELNDITLRGKH